MAAGYGAAQLFQEGGTAYTDLNSGAYFTPEQADSAFASMLPGAATLAGAFIGAATPIGPFAGAAILGGAGNIAQSAITANDTRQQTERETAERLASALGSAADNVERFKSVLEATHAPMQQLAQGVAVVQAMSPGIGPESVAGIGRMATASGEYYGEIAKSVGGFLARDPALYQAADRFSRVEGTDIGREGYQNVADLALARGDMDTYNNARMGVAVSNLSYDPQYKKLYDRASDLQQDPVLSLEHNLNKTMPWLSWIAPSIGIDPIQAAENARDQYQTNYLRTHAQPSPDAVADMLGYQGARFDVLRSGTLLDTAQSGFQRTVLTGGSLEAQASQIPGIIQAANVGIAADERIIARDREFLDKLDPKNSKAAEYRAGWESEIEEREQHENRLRLVEPSTVRSFSLTGIATRESENALNQSRLQYELTANLLSGKSYNDMANVENDITGNAKSIARWLNNEANVEPGLLPSERARMRTDAVNQLSQAASQDNAYRFGAIEQDVRQDEMGVSRLQNAATRIATNGSPQEIYQAGEASVKALTSEFETLTNALKQSNLTLDQRMQLEAQRDNVQTRMVVQHHNDVVARDNGMVALDSFGAEAADSYASLDRLNGGSRAGLLQTAQAVSDATVSRKKLLDMSDDVADYGEVDRARFASEAAKVDQANAARWLNATNYSPAPELAGSMIKDRGALDRASFSFMESGNVNQIRGRLFSDIGREITELGAQEEDQRKAEGGHLTQTEENSYERQRQGLLTERAHIGYDMDRSFFAKLPAVTLGGTSFAQRYLPTYSQAAAYTENVAPTVAAANFGFFNPGTFNQMGGDVGTLGTAGKSTHDIAPGNLSLQALADVLKASFTEALRQYSGAVSGAARPPSPGATIQSNNSQTRGLAGGGLIGGGH